MKKFFSGLLSLVICLALVPAGVFAEEECNVNLVWRGDYVNMEIIIDVTTSSEYIQELSVAMYPAGQVSPSLENYCRVGQVTVKPGESGEVRFKLSDALDSPNGAYKLLVQGNGVDAEKSRCEKDIWILKPTDINKADGLLALINSADEKSISGYVEEIKNALQLTVSDNESAFKLQTFINIRKNDYSGSFKSMNDVRTAWLISDIIECLSKGDADIIGEKAEEIAAELNIDTSDSDYVKYKSEIYKTIITVNKAFNGGRGVLGYADLKKAFKQAKAVAVINNTDIDDMSGVVEKYYRDIEITDDAYNKFGAFSSSNKKKVLRQLADKNFQNAAEAFKAFTDAVNQINGGSSEPSYDSGSGSGGSSGGGGGKGGISGGFASTGSEEQQPEYNEFNDCKSGHWSYSYVKDLKNKGILSGYSDGNFYPDRTVTREEFIKMAVLASGLYSDGLDCGFGDTLKGEWYYSFISSAAANNIVSGDENGLFGIGREISREDVAVIVYRIINRLSPDAEKNEDLSLPEFSDAEDISDYAAEGVSALKNMQILNGFEDGSFKPLNSLTRAEAAKIICLMQSRIGK